MSEFTYRSWHLEILGGGQSGYSNFFLNLWFLGGGQLKKSPCIKPFVHRYKWPWKLRSWMSRPTPGKRRNDCRRRVCPKAKGRPLYCLKIVYVAPLALKHANLQFVLVLMNDDVTGCEIALQCFTFRPRLELHANKMQWYLATLNQPECHEVNIFRPQPKTKSNGFF